MTMPNASLCTRVLTSSRLSHHSITTPAISIGPFLLEPARLTKSRLAQAASVTDLFKFYARGRRVTLASNDSEVQGP